MKRDRADRLESIVGPTGFLAAFTLLIVWTFTSNPALFALGIVAALAMIGAMIGLEICGGKAVNHAETAPMVEEPHHP